MAKKSRKKSGKKSGKSQEKNLKARKKSRKEKSSSKFAWYLLGPALFGAENLKRVLNANSVCVKK